MTEATGRDTLRVVVIADDPLSRAGLVTYLANQAGCLVVGEAGSRNDLVALLLQAQPDVCLWDLGWDPSVELDRLGEVSKVGGAVVALLPNDAYAAEALSAGARGLLFRDVGPSRLQAALASVAQGFLVLEPSLAEAAGRPGFPTLDSLDEELTPRELEVLGLLAEGLPNKAIAARLGVSEHTVKFHVNAILRKLGVQSRTEAVVRGTRLGLILL